jgi:nitrogen regulatory protein P-II 1
VEALHTIEGAAGATFWPVHGFGRGRGDEPGAARHEDILGAIGKVRFEVMVSDRLADTVVRTILQVARTGRKRDGKVFVTSLEQAIRIRTGEEGDAAV